nr:uncharacterized protein LOC122269906 [Parasteatoda tepidariorum]
MGNKTMDAYLSLVTPKFPKTIAVPGVWQIECPACKYADNLKKYLLRDTGKGLTDCRFRVPFPLPHFHRNIPGYGPAYDFDLPVHKWNCAVPGVWQIECPACKYTDNLKKYLLRDTGKGLTDCRFRVPFPLPHFHRNIPGYGPAYDFDLPVHKWNCAGHCHCKHGTPPLVGTMMRNDYSCENAKT